MKILIVEDDPKIADFLKNGLEQDGYQPIVAITAEIARDLAHDDSISAFILDIMLPGMDGIELCRHLREEGIVAPIMMLTAKDNVSDTVTGLSAGADDYLSKPFEYAELLARLRALIRKTQGYPRTIIEVADLSLDPNTKKVVRSGIELDLSKKEYQLLEYLARRHGRMVTREMISKSVWDCDTNTYTNIIDVFITHLRRKVDVPGATKLIHTIRGKGFILSASEPDSK